MRTSRLAPIRAAALLATAFIAIRIIYRVLFGGASGGGILVLDLPRIPLDGPFSHITLFGPITTGGLLSAAVSALPFAAVILGFGALAAVVDLRALVSRGTIAGPVRNLSRALVIAWATFPALIESARRAHIARRLRGERSAIALVIPVLENTIERALALGASMEVRGFAGRTTVSATALPSRSALEPDCARPVEIRDAALGFDGRTTLSNITFALPPASLTLISGPTGSGKSTLLHAMSGLVQHFLDGEQCGDIRIGGIDRLTIPPRDTAGFVGVVSQSVRLSFVAPTVSEELGFALAVRGVAPVIVRARAIEVAERLGILHLIDRDIDALSAGEATLVAIGAAIISQPTLVLVDEPLADLDDHARERVVDVLDRLAHEAGVCVVVAEHNLTEWDAVADHCLAIRDSTVIPAPVHTVHSKPDQLSGQGTRTLERPGRSIGSSRSSSPIAMIRRLSAHRGDITVVRDASFDLWGGDIVALTGPNGAGKSSMMHALALPESAGTVTIGGSDVSRLSTRARRRAIALVPESFDDLLFSTTVGEECRRSGADTVRIFANLLNRDVDRQLARHPRDLSAGERLCLVIAIQLATEPKVLLVDEPTRGLDAAARDLVGHALARAAASGAAVMVATHDHAFAARFCSRIIAMRAGRVDAEVAA